MVEDIYFRILSVIFVYKLVYYFLNVFVMDKHLWFFQVIMYILCSAKCLSLSMSFSQCLSLSLSWCLSQCLSLDVSLNVSLNVFLSLSLNVSLNVSLPQCLSQNRTNFITLLHTHYYNGTQMQNEPIIFNKINEIYGINYYTCCQHYNNL